MEQRLLHAQSENLGLSLSSLSVVTLGNTLNLLNLGLLSVNSDAVHSTVMPRLK